MGNNHVQGDVGDNEYKIKPRIIFLMYISVALPCDPDLWGLIV